MITIEERVRKLEASAAYQERWNKRIVEALKSAAGQLVRVEIASSLQEIAERVKSAGGQILGMLKGGEK